MTYDNALNKILSKQSLGIMPGLSRIQNILNDIDNPQNKIKAIHIAGTNGKGTISKTICDELIKQGNTVGLFTSPWITDYREQIQINNQFISKDDFAYYVNKYYKYDSTEFELLTAIMYKYFCDKNVDYAVVECGMGGLGDSTNVMDSPIVSVITSISIDHTNFFGNTILDIAKEKSGIIKNNCPTILYPNPSCENIFKDVCNKNNSNLICVENSNDYKLNNLNTVNATLNLLGFNNANKLSQLIGRQQFINNILVDGSHNVGAGTVLSNNIKENSTALIGMMKDKEVEKYLSLVAPKCKKIITTTPSNSRAMDSEELKEIANKYCSDVVSISNPKKALEFLNIQNNNLIICGSFYLIRDIFDLL